MLKALAGRDRLRQLTPGPIDQDDLLDLLDVAFRVPRLACSTAAPGEHDPRSTTDHIGLAFSRPPTWHSAAHRTGVQPLGPAVLAMPATRPFPRFLAPRLREALRDTPAVLVHGARQTGKTTLARTIGEDRGYRYVTFDDDTTLAAAKADPAGFLARLPARCILDEVQRVPEIFTSLKATIDARRTAGRFILTGSANVLFVPKLADSLAGRMGILTLHPLSQCEIEGARPRFLDDVLHGRLRTSLGVPLGRDLARRITDGGYPAAAPGIATTWKRTSSATSAT